ncbi:MAG: D-glycero-beta-D-manno-heptose 1-phosphate adenylyltransferase [Gemmatimonadota bacterium]
MSASASPSRNPQEKILERPELLRRFAREAADSVVFTNGVFDLLHPGHVDYLVRARALGDTLVVGVNSDASARRLAKGTGRPVNPAEDRALLLASLECVDAVCIFDEDTPLELIRALRPHVLVKGGDYAREEMVGADEVEAAGGRVAILPFLEGYSTTALIRRIQENLP